MSPNVNAVSWSFAAVHEMDICADVFAFRVRDNWTLRHVEGSGPQIGSFLLSKRFFRGFQGVLSSCSGALGGIGGFFTSGYCFWSSTNELSKLGLAIR